MANKLNLLFIILLALICQECQSYMHLLVPTFSSMMLYNILPTPILATLSNITTDSTTIDATCYVNQDWQPDYFRNGQDCVTAQCSENMLNGYEIYLKCNSWERPEEPQVIAYSASDYILLRGKEMTIEKLYIKKKRVSEQNQREHFYTEYGYFRKSFFLQYEEIFIDFTDLGLRDHVIIAPVSLEAEITAFQCTIFENVYRPLDLIKYQAEITALRSALEILPTKELVGETEIFFMLNSNILTFEMDPPKAYFRDYFQFRLYLRDPQGTTNHRCVRMIGDMAYWTDSNCYPHLITETYVECYCETFQGRYAILSDEATDPPEPQALQKTTLKDILRILSFIGVGAAVASILLPYIMKCNHLGGMLKLYKVSDCTFAIYCVIFLIGILKSDNVKTAKLIAAALHFLHHASNAWILAEGIHLFHQMSPLYTDAVGMLFFYSTFAFGIAASLAGAAMGYDFQFTGQTQYVWPFASGGDMMYLFIPTIGMILLQVGIDLMLVYELMSWIGTKYDYLYTRSVSFIKRSTGYTLVYSVTHFLGVSSMQRNGSGAFPYLFMGFFGIQVMCIFYHHFFSNIECWSHREMEQFKKELAQIKKLEESLQKYGENYASSSEGGSSDDDNDGSDKKSKKDYAIINLDGRAKHEIEAGDPLSLSSQSLNNSRNPLILSSGQDTLRDEIPLNERDKTNIRQSPTIPVDESPEKSDKSADKPENEDENVNKEEAMNDQTEEISNDNEKENQQEEKKQPSEEHKEDDPDDNPPMDEPAQINKPADDPKTEEERPPSQASIASTVSNKSTAPL